MAKTRVVEVVRWLEELGYKSDDLDELVIDAKSSEASELNNGGIYSQVDYLLQYGYTVNTLNASLS